MPTKSRFIFVGLLFLCSLFLTIGNASALPVAGETVRMGVESGGYPYSLTDLNDTADASDDIKYIAFCVEYYETFSIGGVYTVESVSEYAKMGGSPSLESGGYGGSLVDLGGGVTGDPVSENAKKLYVAYLTNMIGGYTAMDVQYAIWYLEGEKTEAAYSGAWTILQQYVAGVSLDGWDLAIVNIVDSSGNYRQSQLVGAPVPEPATLMLLGTGLLGVGFASRRRFRK